MSSANPPATARYLRKNGFCVSPPSSKLTHVSVCLCTCALRRASIIAATPPSNSQGIQQSRASGTALQFNVETEPSPASLLTPSTSLSPLATLPSPSQPFSLAQGLASSELSDAATAAPSLKSVAKVPALSSSTASSEQVLASTVKPQVASSAPVSSSAAPRSQFPAPKGGQQSRASIGNSVATKKAPTNSSAQSSQQQRVGSQTTVSLEFFTYGLVHCAS